MNVMNIEAYGSYRSQCCNAKVIRTAVEDAFLNKWRCSECKKEIINVNFLST